MIVDITKRLPAKPFEHADATLLKLIARWHVARNEARAEFARDQHHNVFGHADSDYKCRGWEFMEAMKSDEALLSTWKPETVDGAAYLIGMVMDIHAEALIDPESHLAEGPCIDILRNVKDALLTLPMPQARQPGTMPMA